MMIVSLSILLYVWVMYPLLLFVLAFCLRKQRVIGDNICKIKISVVIAAHNEAKNLPSRIKNIYESNYPKNLIEVIIASDGSIDDTKVVCEQMNIKYPKIICLDIQPQGGRANAHNIAARHAAGDLLVFSDAETRFLNNTLDELVKPFCDDRVGFVSGQLLYANQNDNAITESVGLYWKYERFLRESESNLGLFVFGTGACCAVKKILFHDIPPTGDVDFTTPLDVVLQGYLCIDAKQSLAIDEMPGTVAKEFRSRVRMTSKNLHGTIARWTSKGLFAHPIYSWVILSHKIGRWITPFAMIGLLLGSVTSFPSTLSLVLLTIQLFFYFLVFFGFCEISLPFAKTAFSFFLANLGFFLGVLNALTGRVPSLYKPMNQNIL